MTIDNSLSPDPTEASITEELQNAIPAQSNSSKTTYTIINSENFNPDADDQIDVQVKAIIGHNFTRWYQTYAIDHYWAGIPRYNDTKVLSSYQDVTQDSESNWSETQTVTIPQSTPSPSPNPPIISLSTNTIITIIGIIAILSLTMVIALLLYVRHLKKAYLNNSFERSDNKG